ncbi:MAG: hypothetical protein A2854_00085 [Parcubacteria group bacterium RIFCSPHIGHO2_01_FULL_56_18]|nr:MAG: hypothetical protein A2854_00085 [Parcubacteria group bacterium RIFCSPHIGHO2_01_FULL_56_18]
MRKETKFVDADLDEVRARFTKQFEGIQMGEVILVEYGGEYALMRYQSHCTEVEKDNVYRMHRGMYIGSASRLLEAHNKDAAPRVRDTDRYKGNIFASKCLKFEYDPEFDIYLPTAWHPDVFVRLATRYSDGRVLASPDAVNVTRGWHEIRAKMREMVRLHYFDTVIDAFMYDQPSGYRLPRWHTRTWMKGVMAGLWASYARAAWDLKKGDFIYVGSKEEVFLFGVARESDGSMFWQGTYIASTKPPFYFTNARLDHYGAKEEGFLSDVFDVGWRGAVGRIFDSELQERRRKQFICPQMGRHQNCKYTVFTGQPQVITGDLERALEHFATTDFFEYADIVERYAKEIRVPHPTLRPNGYGFYT